MRREIKFRGRDIQTGNWVFGFLSFPNEITVDIRSLKKKGLKSEIFIIDPKTIGQFTGHKDKSGVEIYDGDIVNVPQKSKEHEKAVVRWNFNWYELRYIDNNHSAMLNPFTNIEVVANIHDNADLLHDITI